MKKFIAYNRHNETLMILNTFSLDKASRRLTQVYSNTPQGTVLILSRRAFHEVSV